MKMRQKKFEIFIFCANKAATKRRNRSTGKKFFKLKKNFYVAFCERVCDKFFGAFGIFYSDIKSN